MTHPASSEVRGYAICTAPRSGSNYLCQLLSSTRLLGRPLEYFNGPGRRYFDDPEYPDEPRQQISRILSMGATPNGIYGVKIFAHQHDWFSGDIRWTEHLPGLRFIFLTRRDILGQAISWTRALQSGQYRHTQPQLNQPHYTAEAIEASLRRVVTEYARWDMYFARNGIRPLRLVYEDIAASPQAATVTVAELMSLSARPVLRDHDVEVAIQRDEINENWRQRFISERGSMDILDSM